MHDSISLRNVGTVEHERPDCERDHRCERPRAVDPVEGDELGHGHLEERTASEMQKVTGGLNLPPGMKLPF